MKKLSIVLFCFVMLLVVSCSQGNTKKMTKEEKNSLTYSEVADIFDDYLEKANKGIERGTREYWDYVASLITDEDESWAEIENSKEYSQYLEEFIDYSWAFRMLNEKTGQTFKIDDNTKLPVLLENKTMKEIRSEYGDVGHKFIAGMNES